MESTRGALPTSLKAVAYFLIFEGVCAAIDIIVSLARGHVNINLGVLAIFAGFGILRLSRGWRTFALVTIWIVLIAAPIAAIALIAGAGPARWKVFGQVVGAASNIAAIVVTLVVFAINLWMYRVLTRPDVRLLFGLGPSRASTP